MEFQLFMPLEESLPPSIHVNYIKPQDLWLLMTLLAAAVISGAIFWIIEAWRKKNSTLDGYRKMYNASKQHGF